MEEDYACRDGKGHNLLILDNLPKVLKRESALASFLKTHSLDVNHITIAREALQRGGLKVWISRPKNTVLELRKQVIAYQVQEIGSKMISSRQLLANV
jgi:hypothetical protein